MNKMVLLLAFLFMAACAHLTSKRELTHDDRTWIVQECQARYPEPDKNSWCLIKLTEALVNAYANQTPQWDPTTRRGSTPVYRADECTGPVINGKCHGSIIPDSAVPQRCYGTVLNGECIGPQF